MATYQLTNTPNVIDPDGVWFLPGSGCRQDVEYQAFLAGGGVPDPAPPPPIVYAGETTVGVKDRTTDAVAKEIYRFPCTPQRVYQAALTISGVDAANFASKVMEGRFTFKRAAAGAIVVGITVVSDIHDAAAAAWAPNCIANGNDVVFTVSGAAGRTVDWLLAGTIGAYAPGGTPAT